MHTCMYDKTAFGIGYNNTSLYVNVHVIEYLTLLKLSLSGTFAGNRLWRDDTFSYIMYHPVCIGNETNILDCHYDTTPRVPSSCGSYNNYETSVICLPSKIW